MADKTIIQKPVKKTDLKDVHLYLIGRTGQNGAPELHPERRDGRGHRGAAQPQRSRDDAGRSVGLGGSRRSCPRSTRWRAPA